MGPFDYSVSEFGIKDTSNTDLFALNGELVSLWYNAGNPVALDPQTLATKGSFRLDGRGDAKMSAPPRWTGRQANYCISITTTRHPI